MRSTHLAALAVTAAVCLPIAASADRYDNDGYDNGRHDNGRHDNDRHDIGHYGRGDRESGVLKVALWGDEFYNDDPAEKSRQIEQTIQSMNRHDLDFTLFAGDTKNGGSLCTDQAIGADVRTIFDSLNAPTLYTVGDNEWTDCHRTNNGAFDPIERLAFIRNYFFDKKFSQGLSPIPLQRQGALGREYSENSRFVKKDVEFVALHIPGSNNNLVVTDSQCTKKSNRSPADCDAATAEYMARNPKNIEWLESSFDAARQRRLAGIVILIQADVFFPFELSDGGYAESFLPSLDETNGYTDFWNALVAETHDFNGQVLLIHGDSHYFKMDKAMVDDDGRITPNFTRIEVFGSADNSWVEMTVDPTSENVFSFVPVVLE